MLVVFCLFIVWGVLVTNGSVVEVLEQDSAQALQQLSGLFTAVWVGSVALLGWISLMLLRRMNITAMGATVDQVLLRLAKNAGVTAVQATDIRRSTSRAA